MLLSNGFLHDTDSQRIRPGVYANGGTDLEGGNGVDVVSLFFQSACQSVAELYGFFIILPLLCVWTGDFIIFVCPRYCFGIGIGIVTGNVSVAVIRR